MADDAVGVADLAATGTPSSTTFLRGDNAWATPTDTNTTYSVQDGELSQINFTSADNSKLDGIATSANNYVHPNHSGDVVSAADGAMTIQTDAVDIAMLSATGTPGSTTFLRGDNSWAAAGSPSIVDGGNATAMTIDSNERIGVGTTSPQNPLEVSGDTNYLMRLTQTGTNKHMLKTVSNGASLELLCDGANNYVGLNSTTNGDDIRFQTNDGNERVRILAAGGLTFNGDTAAANALDDYEEGTFTIAMYSGQTGTVTNHFAKYTKIGRNVTLNFRGTINGAQNNSFVRISGFPFSLANINYAATANYSNSQSVQLFMSSGGYFYYQSTTVGGNNQGENAAWLDAETGIAINVTYIS
jgi:hypothetical protein